MFTALMSVLIMFIQLWIIKIIIRLKKFSKERKISEIKFFFVTLANCGRKRAKKPMDVTEDILDTANLADLEAIAAAMRDTLDEARRVETVGGGLADDEGTDALAAEYDAKNG